MSAENQNLAKKRKAEAISDIPVEHLPDSILLLLITENGDCFYYLRRNDTPLNSVEDKCIQRLERFIVADFDFIGIIQTALDTATAKGPHAPTADPDWEQLGRDLVDPAFSVACFAHWVPIRDAFGHKINALSKTEHLRLIVVPVSSKDD